MKTQEEVVRCFLLRKPCYPAGIRTDGGQLWCEGTVIAKWDGGVVMVTPLGSHVTKKERRVRKLLYGALLIVGKRGEA